MIKEIKLNHFEICNGLFLLFIKIVQFHLFQDVKVFESYIIFRNPFYFYYEKEIIKVRIYK